MINDDKRKLALEIIEKAIAMKQLIRLSPKERITVVVREPRAVVAHVDVGELRVGTQATGGVVVRLGDGSDSARRVRARLSNLGAGVAQLPAQKRRAIVKAQESISDARRSAEMHEGQLRIN